MKNLFFLLILVMSFAQCTPTAKVGDNGNTENPAGPVAQPTTDGGTLDRSIPPTAGDAPEIKIGDYDKFTLDNGVEVIVVTNNKLPRVSFSLEVDADPVLEGDKAGMVDLTGQLLRRGTKTRTKAEIDEAVDFIGANMNTSGRGISASSLSKHQDLLLELMSDVLLNPTFADEELEKLKKQTISGLASEKDSPNAIAANVGNVLDFGKKHPYGEIVTEETVTNVTSADCKKYYNDYFKPNTTRLVIVGDVDAKTLKSQLNKYFGSWKKGEVPTSEYNTPTAPKATEVAFVDKPGAVQSVVKITYPVDLKPGSQDAIAASVMNTILGGGGFSARLMQNLREDKAYTYGAYSSLISNELIGEFSASASVRNEVTDSAITQFLYEIQRMRDEKVDEDALNLILNTMTGSFSRALERPETVARFAKNIEKYNLPKDYYKNYLKNLRAVTADDVQAMAKKYLLPSNAHILVVGNKDEVADKLSGFSKSGKVNFYDNEGNPVKVSNEVLPADLTATKVVENYLAAIGGKAKIEAIEDAKITMGMAMTGATLDAVTMIQTGKKMMLELSMMGQVVQKQVFDGKKMSAAGQVQEPTGKALAELKSQTMLVDEINFLSEGYNLELKGTETINDAKAYKIAVESPEGVKSTHYFDAKTGLQVRIIGSSSSPMGEVTVTSDISDYQTLENGIKYPFKVKQQMGPQAFELSIKSVELNTGIADSVFAIE